MITIAVGSIREFFLFISMLALSREAQSYRKGSFMCPRLKRREGEKEVSIFTLEDVLNLGSAGCIQLIPPQ